MKPIIGRHVNFDDHHYWSFPRTSGLPRGYFDKPKIITMDRLLALAGLIVFVVTLGVI